MPRGPVLTEERIVPREIHGIVVYQTAEEERKLNLIEYSSVGVFLVGLGLGLVYLEKWGSMQVRAGEEDSELAKIAGLACQRRAPAAVPLQLTNA